MARLEWSFTLKHKKSDQSYLYPITFNGGFYGVLIIYRNPKYRFRLTFPLWWRRWTFIVQKDQPQKVQTGTVDFNLRYRKPIQGKKSTNIFSIVIFRMSLPEWEKQYRDSPFHFLGNRGGLIFSAIPPGEPPEEFLLPDGSEYNRNLLEFQLLTRMINNDLPRILKSFRFI